MVERGGRRERERERERENSKFVPVRFDAKACVVRLSELLEINEVQMAVSVIIDSEIIV